MSKHTEQQTT